MSSESQDMRPAYEGGQFAPKMSCRLGDFEHHTASALLHLITLLGCCLFHARQRASRLQRGLVCGGSALNVAVHLLLAGGCWSPAISATVHAHLATLPVVRLSGSQVVANALLTAAAAVHFVKLSSKGTVRMLKLGTLSVLALVNILMQG